MSEMHHAPDRGQGDLEQGGTSERYKVERRYRAYETWRVIMFSRDQGKARDYLAIRREDPDQRHEYRLLKVTREVLD